MLEKASNIKVSFDPIVEGFQDGVDVLIDIVLSLLPYIFILGIFGLLLVLFKFRGGRD